VLTVPSKDGTTIAFDWLGAGPAVVLVGGVATTRAAHAALAELLAERFTAVNYDRRGRGDSGDATSYSLDDEIGDLEAVIGAVGGTAGVYGSSSGAVLALEAAARGLPMTRLALWEPPFDLDPPQLQAEETSRLAELLADGRRDDAVALLMTVVDRRPTFVAQAGPDTAEAVNHTLAYDAVVMGDGAVPAQRIASITMPALVLDGSRSPTWTAEVARVVAGALPDARRRTLDGADHRVPAADLAPLLADFFGA
jgi:pimeloyl-ACP methyl ester carboxylesterase